VSAPERAAPLQLVVIAVDCEGHLGERRSELTIGAAPIVDEAGAFYMTLKGVGSRQTIIAV
jgi:hypothetical protein